MFFPEFSFSEPSVGKSPEVKENPSFLEDVPPCTYSSYNTEKASQINKRKVQKQTQETQIKFSLALAWVVEKGW